ncbi:transcription termination/antitermination protein NusA [candidate division WS5 bacterium]|uniref:Transcription termination/antitermination protein NusA n=1 Tax=candidate division WS5 bacterium TaxID=2093353 RepID=A0A419DAJ6_9BACT|nr:MAG: transcription termination/antitermination protein NusA [candidate division WS5 bacterium]
MQVKFAQAIGQICDEKNLSRDVVMETVKAALASAYKKDYGSKDQEVRVEIDEETGAIKVYVIKEVVDEVEDKMTQISVVDASKVKKGAKVGDSVEILDIPADFGRIAAQTAKQVIIQRIREAERDMVFEEFKDKEGELANGTIQRVEGDTVIVDLGKATGVLYKSEQMAGEHYYTGQRVKVYVVKVESATRGPQIILSRSHPDMVRKLFEMEVPEILAGTIEIKSIAREGGERTKIAVYTNQEGIDPVGALVGQRGSRVQSVMNEIGDEKIDIILWDEDIKTYIINALSPAKVIEVKTDEKEKKATVKVPEDQLSLAIGKKGQNVRLAAKLTGWNVDIAGTDDAGIEGVQMAAQETQPKKKAADLEDEIIKNISSQENSEEGKSDTEVDAQEAGSEEEAKQAQEAKTEEGLAKEISGEAESKEPKIIKDEREPIEGSDVAETPYAGETVAEAVLDEEKIKGEKQPEGKNVEDVLNEEAASSQEEKGSASESKKAEVPTDSVGEEPSKK